MSRTACPQIRTDKRRLRSVATSPPVTSASISMIASDSDHVSDHLLQQHVAVFSLPPRL